MASLVVVALVAMITMIWRDDILEALLDPHVPYAVYRPPPRPDYAAARSWAMLPLGQAGGTTDIFFIHPTTFDGGRDWNGPISDRRASALLKRVMLPNYAGPFSGLGPVYAPLYRQASLYTSLTLFDDAIEAREFAYRDVLASFRRFQAMRGSGRPFIVVGVEQGGSLAARLVREEIAGALAPRERLVAAYLIDTVVPADEFRSEAKLPACGRADQVGCALAWMTVGPLDLMRAARIKARGRVWNDDGHLVELNGREPLCVNPIFGRETAEAAPERLHLGAANATGLEWGVRPGFMARQVSAQCVEGLLHVGRPRSKSLRPSGNWSERLKAPPYNLFWADIEADAVRRSETWVAARRAQPASLTPPSERQSNKDRST